MKIRSRYFEDIASHCTRTHDILIDLVLSTPRLDFIILKSRRAVEGMNEKLFHTGAIGSLLVICVGVMSHMQVVT